MNYQSSLAPLHIFMTNLWQETVTHGQHGQGAPQRQVKTDRQILFFSYKSSVEVGMKQSQVTAGSRAAFHGAAAGGSIPATPADVKAGISSATCLCFVDTKAQTLIPHVCHLWDTFSCLDQDLMNNHPLLIPKL